jgi:hypothetical protein
MLGRFGSPPVCRPPDLAPEARSILTAPIRPHRLGLFWLVQTMLSDRGIVLIWRRSTVCAVVLITFALMAGGCRRQESGSFVVGFSQMEHNNPWRLAQTASIKAEAANRHYELVVTDAQGQTSRQVSQVEDLVARRVNLILLAPRESRKAP